MRLEIAAGKNPQMRGESWFYHDQMPYDHIHFICDWSSIPDYMMYLRVTEFEDLYCRHFIEHLDPAHGEEFIRMCYSILRKNGTLTIVCPNMKWLCNKYLTGGYANVSEFVCWMFGGGDEQEWSYHKTGYDCSLLCRLMRIAGFDIKSFNDQGFHLEVIGVKS